MKNTPVRAWLRAVLLVPTVFTLAIAAAGLTVGTLLPKRSSVEMHLPSGRPPDARSTHPGVLIIPVELPPTAGSGPLDLTVRIATTPPAPDETLEASRGYLTGLLRSLVESLPRGWTPDAEGLATLQRAIEEAVPVSLAPSLPEGTRVTVEISVAPPAFPLSP